MYVEKSLNCFVYTILLQKNIILYFNLIFSWIPLLKLLPLFLLLLERIATIMD